MDMGRRKQSSLEALIDIASYMPWWIGVLLAIISYFVLDLFAGHTGNNIWETILLVFKYFFLIGFIVAAVLSAVKQWKRESTFEEQTGNELDIDDDQPTVVRERPNCPKCGGRMVKRTAIKGVNAGKEFWGCSAYPKCGGIVNIEN
jgi:hypothetical protein